MQLSNGENFTNKQMEKEKESTLCKALHKKSDMRKKH